MSWKQIAALVVVLVICGAMGWLLNILIGEGSSLLTIPLSVGIGYFSAQWIMDNLD